MNERQIVIKATVSKLQELIEQWSTNSANITFHQGEVKRLQEAQAALEVQAQKCGSTAELFGFDIKEEMSRAQLTSDPMPVVTGSSALPATVEEFIELMLSLSYPHTMRASELQAEYESQVRKIHPKTIGMLLYRMSKKRVVRRVSRVDWQYVPPEERLAVKQNLSAEPELSGEAAE